MVKKALNLKPLKKGDKGAEVMVMQGILRAAHFCDADGNLLEIDGDYGRRTQEAVDSYHETCYKYSGGNYPVLTGEGFSITDWYNLIGVKTDDGYMD